jgi:hypothetical protein
LTDSNIHGRVMTITESEYSAEEKFGEVKKLGLLSKVIYKYNEKGNLTEQSKYNSDGSLDSREIHKFDTKENEIEWTKYEDGSLKSTVTYKYDDTGHKIESNFDGTYITKYKYNSKGNQIASYSMLFENRDTSIYDERNNIIENYQYGTTQIKTLYSYDEMNRLIKSICTREDEKSLIYETAYKFDNKGNVIEKEDIYGYGIFEYNDGLSWYGMRDTSNTSDQSWRRKKGKTKTSLYDNFDSSGNWLRLKSLENHFLKAIKEREIQYY